VGEDKNKSAELKLGSTQKSFRRKNIRLPELHYLGRRSCFVTLCFDRRRKFGANPRIARWLAMRLQKYAHAGEFFLHAFCIMPDHLHFLATAASERSNFLEFIERFKQDTAFHFTRRTKQRLWQFKYYDHILRRTDREDRVAWYIWMNPVRKEICRVPNDYPFAGSFTQVGAKLLQTLTPLDRQPPWKIDDVQV